MIRLHDCCAQDRISLWGANLSLISNWIDDDPGGLHGRIAGHVAVPGDTDWDQQRAAWNLAADQHPVAVALPESSDDVIAIVEFARDVRM